MKLSASFKSHFIYVVALLHIVLYVYAAVNKLLDFENFQVQLGQSPLLSAFAGFVSYVVPAVEFVIVGFLFFGSTRYLGLYASLCLMAMFTTYIFIMLHFSSFVPCSCGGILEKLSWHQHLIFNVSFFIINLNALLLHDNPKAGLLRKRRSTLAGALLSIVVVVVLFLLSEDTIHHRNNFVRRFPHHPAVLKHLYDLKHTSYYLAGVDNGNIYLANSIAPLAMTVFDTALKHKRSYRITLPPNSYPFKNVKVVVCPPYFYLADGTVPVIFRGKTTDWKADVWMESKVYFSKYVVLSENTIGIRALSSQTGENLLGIISKDSVVHVSLNATLLTKQLDGVFDTDGYFTYNKDRKQLLYLYAYRNQYLQIDSLLHKTATGKTIDTVSKAHLKVAYIASKKESKLAAPPLVVNKNAFSSGKYLFVSAGLMGKYEDRDSWDTSTVIDVYDLTNRTYALSFYITDYKNQKMTDFMIDHDLLVAVIGPNVVTYRLKQSLSF